MPHQIPKSILLQATAEGPLKLTHSGLVVTYYIYFLLVIVVSIVPTSITSTDTIVIASVDQSELHILIPHLRMGSKIQGGKYPNAVKTVN